IDYTDRVFRSVEHPDITGHYHSDGDLVWAEFSGAPVSLGRLVGHRAADGSLELAYSYRLASGDLVAGRCTSRPEVLPDGRIRLTEHFRRLDGKAGVSVIEELPRPHIPRPLAAGSDG
ncbi:MAG: hypothetical protein ACRDUA_05400, partial [Micromonosporaceae bacterium]